MMTKESVRVASTLLRVDAHLTGRIGLEATWTWLGAGLSGSGGPDDGKNQGNQYSYQDWSSESCATLTRSLLRVSIISNKLLKYFARKSVSSWVFFNSRQQTAHTHPTECYSQCSSNIFQGRLCSSPSPLCAEITGHQFWHSNKTLTKSQKPCSKLKTI